MVNKEFPLIGKPQLRALKEALNFLHVDELKDICTKLSIPSSGKKGFLVMRILHLMETGEVIEEPKIPAISVAKRGQKNPLHPKSLILKGAYKNDLKTRLFFKELIGEHFHFTAFGIDWLNDCWISGNPPTYQAFADMWIAEVARRKRVGSTPKEEWAYINFTQKFLRNQPNASRQTLLTAWEMERKKNVRFVKEFMQKAKMPESI